MAKVNNIKINGTTRYIENISYQTALPTATSDSADFVSVNNELYAKQVNNGVYSYAKVGGDGGVKVIEKTLNEDMTGFVDTFTGEELNDFINGSILRAKASQDANFSYYLTPMNTQQPYEEMYGILLGGITDAGTGSMLLVRVMSMSGEINAQVMTTNGFSMVVEITDVPPTATSGTLYADQLATLQASDSNYIMFNNEKYYLNDKGHTEGYLSYSHVGVVSEDIFVKVITITISTRGWVLVEKNVNEPEPPITLVDTLPEANEENFEKGKIYTTGALLQYISKEAVDTPTIGQVNSLPQVLAFNSAAAVGTNVYIFGGGNSSGSGYVNTIYKYDTTANTATTMSATLPQALRQTAAAAVGSDIYIFGGNYSSNPVKTIYKYDTATNTISTMSATLPRALFNTSAVAVGTDIYVFGGRDKSSFVKTIYKYNTTTNTITTMSTTLPTTLYAASAAVVGTDVYIFGGIIAADNTDTIYKYSTSTNTITTMSATLPVALQSLSAAAVGTNVYIFGGYKSNSPVNTIYKYDTTTDIISTMSTTLPVALYGQTTAAVGSDIYIFGGYGSSYVNTIYKFSVGFNYTFKTLANLDAITNAIETEY